MIPPTGIEEIRVQDIAQFDTYLESLAPLQEFSASYYEIASPLASIQITRGLLDGSEPDTSRWIERIEMAYRMGGGISSIEGTPGNDRRAFLELITCMIASINTYAVSVSRSCHRLVLDGVCRSARELATLEGANAFALQGLRSLDLTRNGLRDSDLANIIAQIASPTPKRGPSILEELILDDNTVGDKSLAKLCGWIKSGNCPLKHLSMRNCGLGMCWGPSRDQQQPKSGFDRILSVLASSPHSRISSLDAGLLARYDMGEVLELYRSSAVSSTAASLTKLVLDDTDMRLGGGGDAPSASSSIGLANVRQLAEVMKATPLKALSLAHCHLEDAQLMALCESLHDAEEEEAAAGGRGDEEAEAEKEGNLNTRDGTGKHLYSLVLSGGRFSSLAAFHKEYPNLIRAQLRHLDVTNCINFTNRDSVTGLFTAAAKSVSLEELVVDMCEITGVHLSLFLKMLALRWRKDSKNSALPPGVTPTRLRRLSIAHNPIGPQGIASMIETLSAHHNTHTLTHLNLCSCLGGAQAPLFAEYLNNTDTVVETIEMKRAELDFTSGQATQREPEKRVEPLEVTLPKFRHIELPLRLALLYSHMVRDRQGKAYVQLPRDVYTSIFEFSLRPVTRTVIIRN
jgi:hypothetical protein